MVLTVARLQPLPAGTLSATSAAVSGDSSQSTSMTAYSPSAIRSMAVSLVDYSCNHSSGERRMNGCSAGRHPAYIIDEYGDHDPGCVSVRFTPGEEG